MLFTLHTCSWMIKLWRVLLFLFLVFVIQVFKKVLSCLLLLWVLSRADSWSNLLDNFIRKNIGFQRWNLLIEFYLRLSIFFNFFVVKYLQFIFVNLRLIQMTYQSMRSLLHVLHDFFILFFLTRLASMWYRIMWH